MKKLIIFILIIIVLSILIVTNSFYELKLKGKKTITIEVNTEYKDEGYSLKHFGKISNEKVKIKNNIDKDKVGEYIVEYSIDKLFYKKTIKRKIIVKDTIKPEITLNGDSEITITAGDEYKELGAKALDNYDGDISNNIQVEGSVDNKNAGEYELIYKIFDSSGNSNEIKRKVKVVAKKVVVNNTGGYGTIIEGPTYIKGILIVNKKYKLPSNFGGTDETASNALKSLQAAALALGHNLNLVSGYRSYQTQATIYNNYIKRWGQTYTDTISARPGHSEHQTGLAFDVGVLDSTFAETVRGKWLKEHCHEYGFIIRYPKGKEHITGYSYEPWHIRYVGVEAATYIMKNNLTLEEYLNV